MRYQYCFISTGSIDSADGNLRVSHNSRDDLHRSTYCDQGRTSILAFLRFDSGFIGVIDMIKMEGEDI